MQVVIFGTGRMYQKTKLKLRNDIEIVAFIDNDSSKWGWEVDGIQVFPPQKIVTFVYDFVFLLSAQQVEMKEQLIELGVSGEKIFGIEQLERICTSESTKYFGDFPKEVSSEKILFFSHALTSTGAQNVLYIATQVLKKRGYQMAVVSKQDGVLKDRILSLGIPVVIMGNPHSDNKEFIELIKWADMIFVNTVWLYYMVEELLRMNKQIIWWIHETVGFEHLGDNLVKNIKEIDMLSVYAVSPLVKRRMLQKLGKDLNIKEMAYGLPKYETVKKGILHQEKKVFAVIGGIGWIKGQDVFIQAVEHLPDYYKEKAEFWIIGHGILKEEDLRRAEQCQCIKIVGEIENQKMPELYSQIDVVVCCSREEAMSVVVTEGCMNEKLVIVSDAAGNADYIVDKEDGLIFQSENIDQLTSLMEWVINNENQAERIGYTSKRIYEKYFDMKIFEDNLLKAIESIGNPMI